MVNCSLNEVIFGQLTMTTSFATQSWSIRLLSLENICEIITHSGKKVGLYLFSVCYWHNGDLHLILYSCQAFDTNVKFSNAKYMVGVKNWLCLKDEYFLVLHGFKLFIKCTWSVEMGFIQLSQMWCYMNFVFLCVYVYMSTTSPI